MWKRIFQEDVSCGGFEGRMKMKRRREVKKGEEEERERSLV
jgi:hypothetical protein